MSVRTKIFIGIPLFALLSLVFLLPANKNEKIPNNTLGGTVLFPSGGGTGKGSATTTDIGSVLMVSSSNPFVYKFSPTSSLGISGIPGGSDTYVQYNNSGSFSGTSSFTFNSSTSVLMVKNIVVPEEGTIDVWGLTAHGQSVLSSLSIAAGSIILDSAIAGSLSFSSDGGTTYANISPTNLTADRTFSFPDTDGTFALTDQLSLYLPLTGGTLSGDLIFTSASGTMITSTNIYAKRITINTSTQSGTISMQGIPGEDLIRITSSSAAAAQMLALKADGQLVVGPNTLGQTGQLTIQSPTTNDVALSFTNGTHYTFQLGRVAGTSGLAFIGGPGGTDLNLRANAIDQVFIRRLGFMGIGSSTPNYNLSVSGTIGVVGLGTDITGNGLCITTAGRITNAGAAACVPSALKYKTNVSPYIESATQLFSSLVEIGAVENYELKSKLGDPRKGLIADLVEKVDPDLVGYSDDGSVNTLHFEDITGLSVKAVSELDKRITSLEQASKVEAKAKNNTVEKIQWVIIIFLFILFIKKNKK